MLKASFPFPHANKPVRTVRPDALEWAEGEKDASEKAMLAHGKKKLPAYSKLRFCFNPHLSHSLFCFLTVFFQLSCRTVGESVEYYYKWKRTERFNAFRRRQRQSEEDYRQLAITLMANGSSKNDSGAWLGENLAKPQA